MEPHGNLQQYHNMYHQPHQMEGWYTNFLVGKKEYQWNKNKENPWNIYYNMFYLTIYQSIYFLTPNFFSMV